jgi:DNA-binding transcriptional LysR family regulator
MRDFDLRDLEAFAAVARIRDNFRRAATELRVSVSSLSQRLRELDERLGVRLMNRTTRSVGLTEAGELLLGRIGPAMRNVGDALDQVSCLRGVPVGAAAHQCAGTGSRPGPGAHGGAFPTAASADRS